MSVYDDYEDDFEEYPHHRKVAKKRKPPHKKSKHKHDYQPCIVGYDGAGYHSRGRVFSKGKYCTLCGKLDVNWFQTTIPLEGSRLPYFDVNMWDKQVELR